MTIDITKLDNAPEKLEIPRLPIGRPVKSKADKYMTKQVMDELFRDRVVIEEKLDGKCVAKQFAFKWGRRGTVPVICFFEYMKSTHSIVYDSLPGWWILVEVKDTTTGKLQPPLVRALVAYQIFGSTSFAASNRLVGTASDDFTPHNYSGRWEGQLSSPYEIEMSFLRPHVKSQFGRMGIEGVVVKNYSKQIFGKAVREEFLKGIELKGHWLTSKDKRNNRLRSKS